MLADCCVRARLLRLLFTHVCCCIYIITPLCPNGGFFPQFIYSGWYPRDLGLLEKNHENSPIGFIKFVKVMPVLPSASAFVLSYSVTIGYGSNYSSMVTCHGMTWLF